MNVNGFLESIFKSGDGVFAIDGEQRIILWNEGAEAILGYAPEDVLGQSCFEVMQGIAESGQAWCALGCLMIGEAREGQLSPSPNLLVKAKDGSLRWLSMSLCFVNSSDNYPEAVVHVFKDATAEVEAKRLLERIADQVSGYGVLHAVDGEGPGPETELTEREKQVLRLLSQGEGTSSIALGLMISNTTARNHIQNILTKLGVHTRLEAVTYALRHRLIDPE